MIYTRDNLNIDFCDLKSRSSIDLSNKCIHSLDKFIFQDLKNLSVINLNSNKLTSLSGALFERLIFLEVLYLNNNRLTHLAENMFVDLKSLNKLHLNMNLIEKIQVNTFNGLSLLTDLHLNHNHISVLADECFIYLINLKRIDLSFNKLKTIPFKAFKGLDQSLLVIYLNNNDLFQSIEADLFNKLNLLSVLYLNNNRLSFLHQNTFNELTNLAILNLSFNCLQRLEKHVFNDLIHLEQLDLSNNQLTELDETIFQNLKDICKIDLSVNQLDRIACDTFAGLAKLKRIYLANNRLTSLRLAFEKCVDFICFKDEWIRNDLEKTIQLTYDHTGNLIYGNRFRKLEHLGQGTYGQVFKVENIKENKKKFALKIFNDWHEKIAAYREAKLLKNIDSEFILKYENCFIDRQNNYYLLTELCEDGDLAALIKNSSSKLIDQDQVYSWSKEIIFGIDYLHQNKIIHRDIKPSNIFLKLNHIKIGDLGHAKDFSASSACSVDKGTYKYWSPEMIRWSDGEGPVYDIKTDVWSTGLVIYELVTLKYPFKQTNELKTLKISIKYDPISADFEASSKQKELIEKMLQKDSKKRATTEELKEIFNQNLKRNNKKQLKD